MHLNQPEIAQAIAARLRAASQQLQAQWRASNPVQHFVVDELLDPAWVRHAAAGFPRPEQMMQLSSLRERKRVGVAVESYPREVQDALFAFQDPAVVEVVREITGLRTAGADPSLYASGLSVMSAGDYLNPHIDNSHDGDGQNYRVLNLLFYVSEGWDLSRGGNLELWDSKVRTPTVIESRFNRLVVMATHQSSWHSVNQVRVRSARRCVSNYYFSPDPPGGTPYRNVTTFTGRPEQPLRRAVLAVTDRLLLNTLGRIVPRLTRKTKHRRRAALQQDRLR